MVLACSARGLEERQNQTGPALIWIGFIMKVNLLSVNETMCGLQWECMFLHICERFVCEVVSVRIYECSCM